ncbi:hypothetical protein [Paraburkholderia sp. CNPSo 3281]|uniref:hypothetical protein n=1 Tax=Paraburkholderia sp. CNPSo 3281 TaxID=2940933 RepID=UPI0020B737CD|nr:hypothetical protein [Paraburkholderia sp. CNPSo 3281]MCP3718992.1 hypothetical protein [Paraburkholderia sp. CNPSo 3281]
MEQIFKGTVRLAGVASRSWPKLAVSLAAACAVLAGCASAGDVTTAGNPGTYVVSASATGGRLAWARAHKRAVSEANDYCESRGMQTSLGMEHTEGLEALQQQASVIRFECHPKL